MRLPRGLRLDLRAPLRLADGLTDGLEREELRLELGEGAQHPRLGVILPEDPQAREGDLGRYEGQIVRRLLLVDVLQQLFGLLERRHQHGAIGNGQPVDRLEAIPGPGLDALGQGVIEADRDVDFLGLVACHVLLELFLTVGDDGEVLGRDAVPLRTIAVAAEGDAPPPRLARRQHDASADAGRQVLLEDPAVDHLTREMRHCRLP
jgi:hypothetical protein